MTDNIDTMAQGAVPAEESVEPTTQITAEHEPDLRDPAKAVMALRDENAKWRQKVRALEADSKRLKELEAKNQEAEQAKLGDLEKATKKLEAAEVRVRELEATLKAERTKWAVAQAAQRLNLDGELAASLIKESDIDYDETGQPQNPEKQLKALLAKWPQLAKREPPPPSINADAGRGTTPPPASIRDEEIKRKYRIS